MTEIVHRAMDLLSRSADMDFGEEITHLEHAIQTYCHLVDNDIEVRVAGFWHDLGHSLCLEDGYRTMKDSDGTILGVDDHDFLVKTMFLGVLPERTCELMGMHTVAKRYQCERDGTGKLSQASIKTMELEGGPLSDEEREKFLASPYVEDALTLRDADNKGKDTKFPKELYPKLVLQAMTDTLKLYNQVQARRSELCV